MKIKIPKPICVICKKKIEQGKPFCYECMKCDKCSPECFEEEETNSIKMIEKVIIKLRNPYPKDIFPPIQESDIKKISKEFPFVFGCSMDRFSAHLMRIARKNILTEIKEKLGEIEK